MAEEQKIYTSTEACRYLRICRNTLYKAMRSGLIKYFMAGTHYRFTKEQLDKYLSGELPKKTA